MYKCIPAALDCGLDVNEFGVITAPGKFEGELYFVAHLWDMAMQGFSYETIHDYGDLPDDYFDDLNCEPIEPAAIFEVFLLEEPDYKLFPELRGEPFIALWEDNNGFVNSVYWSGLSERGKALFCDEIFQLRERLAELGIDPDN